MATATKPKFRSAYSGAERRTLPTGDGTEPIWGYDLDSKGEKILVIKGYKNLYEEIQSHLESTLISNIIAKAKIGDYSGFKEEGIYQDISNIPDNINEAHREWLKLENEWNKLGIDEKRNFNMSFNQFVHEMGTEAWAEKAGYLKPKTTGEAPEGTEEVDIPKEKE